MSHRGDSDWHGWPLQPVVETAAEKMYDRMRRLGPPESPAWGDASPDVRRQCMEAVLPVVTDVIDVLNGMDHPLVSELRNRLTAYDQEIEEVTAEGGSDDLDLVAVSLISDVRKITERYTQED